MIISENVYFMPDGTSIEYVTLGSGPKLLFIHGSNMNRDEKNSVLHLLAQKFTVYCADRRGWRYSGSRGNDYSIEKECEDALELITHYDIMHVFGDEYGAIIALQLALQYPLKKLVIFETSLPSLRNFDWLKKMNKQAIKGRYLDAMVTFIKGTSHKMKYIPKLYIKLIFKYSSFSIDRDKETMAKLIEYEDPEHNARHKKDIESSELKEAKKMLAALPDEIAAAQQAEKNFNKLQSISTPVLILCGSSSEPYVYASADRLLTLLQNGQKVIIDSDFGENRGAIDPPPQDFLESVTRFLQRGE